jgi:hypothetical protein
MFFEAIVQHLHLRAAWQEAQLANIIPATIICLDEPVLDVVGLPFIPIDWPLARAAIEDVLAGISGCRAVYCGGAVDLPQVLELAVDLLIANLQRGDATLIAARTPLAAYLERGGLFGLGVIPNDEEALAQVSADVVLERIETLLAGLAPAGITSAQLLSQAVITPSDTLGNLTPEAAERALQILAETSRLIRERYQLAERA